MKFAVPFGHPPGFIAYEDTGNSVNKVIYSQVRECESRRPSPGISIKYVYEGEEHYELDGQLHTVKPGEFLIVNNGQEVATSVRSSQVVRGICLYADPAHIAEVKRAMIQPAASLLEPQRESAGTFEVRQRVYPARPSPVWPLLQQLGQGLDGLEAKGETIFWQLSQAILSNEYQVSREVAGIEAVQKATREELHRRLTVAKAYILDNLSQPLSVKAIARAATLSEFHFLRTFRQAYGLSPNQFIQQQRLQKAVYLLSVTKAPISEIATACGYSDLQYFSRTFKRYFGLPPSQYRAKSP